VHALGWLALAAGLAVKASAAILLGVDSVALLLERVKVSTRTLLVSGAAGSIALGIVFLRLREQHPILNDFSALIGSPTDPLPHCTRSYETLPRAFFQWVLHMPTASWAIGLAFRLAAALWLLSVAGRIARNRQDTLPLAASGLFIYYLFFHGYSQPWYLLSLLPLLPFADARTRPAMMVFFICQTLTYSLQLPVNCHYSMAPQVTRELLEGALVLFPATFIWWRSR
jgi:hypothetical protein